MAGAADCPACGARTGDDRWCGFCGLDLHSGDARDLRELAVRLAATDAELGAVRARSDALTAELAARRLTAAGRVGVSMSTEPPLHVAERPESAPAGAEWGVERVRDLLLWCGATLLALSALAFTAVAWTHLGPAGRAVLLGVFTVVSALLASALRRRLPASAGAFTGLTIALALIDWQVARRAGAGPGLSTAAWWAIGSAVVGLLSAALGRVAAPVPARRAVALLVPSAAILTVVVAAHAAWSYGLGLALIAAALIAAERILGRLLADRVVWATARALAVTTWLVGAGFAVAAAFGPNDVVQTFAPAGVMLVLTIAPALESIRRRPATSAMRVSAFCVVMVAIGTALILASTSVGPIGLLTLAAVFGSASLALAPSIGGVGRGAASGAGFTAAIPGLGFATVGAAFAEIGPLAWLAHSWSGTTRVRAQHVVVGPNPTHTGAIGWCAVAILVVVAGAIAVASQQRRRAPFAPGSIFGAAALGLLALVLAPVAAGSSALVAAAVATGATALVMIGSGLAARRQSERAVPGALLVLVPAVPAAGWAALTRGTSIAALAVVVVSALIAAAVGRNASLRAADAGLSGAALIALGSVVTLASGGARPLAGFVGALVAGGVLLVGALSRRKSVDGLVVEIIGGAGIVGSVLLALPSRVWVAATFTAIVPLLIVACARRDRTLVYAVAAGAAALGATWSWLAVAGVSVVEAYTLPAAAFAWGAGHLAARNGRVRSWVSLGSAIVLALAPTIALAIVRHDDGRAIAAGVAALLILLVGAWRRLQAPLVLGTVALLTLGVDKLGPQAVRLPRWTMLAIAGAMLLWVGTTFERRRDDVHRATRRLVELR